MTHTCNHYRPQPYYKPKTTQSQPYYACSYRIARDQAMSQVKPSGNTPVRGCCSQHRQAIRQYPELNKQHGIIYRAPKRLGQIFRSSKYKKETSTHVKPQHDALYWDSGYTLKPVHPIMPCHLSLDHLNCIRRQRSLNIHPVKILIPELSSKGFYSLGITILLLAKRGVLYRQDLSLEAGSTL